MDHTVFPRGIVHKMCMKSFDKKFTGRVESDINFPDLYFRVAVSMTESGSNFGLLINLFARDYQHLLGEGYMIFELLGNGETGAEDVLFECQLNRSKPSEYSNPAFSKEGAEFIFSRIIYDENFPKLHLSTRITIDRTMELQRDFGHELMEELEENIISSNENHITLYEVSRSRDGLPNLPGGLSEDDDLSFPTNTDRYVPVHDEFVEAEFNNPVHGTMVSNCAGLDSPKWSGNNCAIEGKPESRFFSGIKYSIVICAAACGIVLLRNILRKN